MRKIFVSLLALLLLGGVFVTVRGYRAYEACRVGDGPGLMNTLTKVQGWVHVVGVVSATRQPEGEGRTLPAVVTDADGSNVTVRIHSSRWPDIDAALAHSDQVWLALSDFAGPPPNFVTYVVMVRPNGNVSFPGTCADQNVVQPLRAQYGDRYNQVMLDALGKTGADLQAVFELPASREPATSSAP